MLWMNETCFEGCHSPTEDVLLARFWFIALYCSGNVHRVPLHRLVYHYNVSIAMKYEKYCAKNLLSHIYGCSSLPRTHACSTLMTYVLKNNKSWVWYHSDSSLFTNIQFYANATFRLKRNCFASCEIDKFLRKNFYRRKKNRTCCAQSFPGVLQLSLA